MNINASELMRPKYPEVSEELYNESIEDIREHAFINDKIPSKLRQLMEMDNIAETLSGEELDRISKVVIDGYEIDKNSRAKWEEVMDKSFELIESDLTEKNTPWPGAANIKYPLVSSACMQFNARTWPEIVKNDRVVDVRLMMPDDSEHKLSERANRLSAHMSYQLLVQSDNWVSDTDKLLMMLPLVGTVFRKSYFDTITGMPATILCLPKEIIINNKVQSLEQAQRITHVLYMTSNQLLEGMRSGIYLDYPLEDLVPGVDVQDSSQIPESFTTQESRNDIIYDYIHKCLEQHRWLDLDGDGYQEPYVVTLHLDSKKVLRIRARYSESSFEFNNNGKFVKINANQHFTDFHFIPNPDGGYYSLGYGCLLMPLNETVNSILNQLVDAGTLANRQIGFIGSELRIPKGDFNFRPGEWKQIPSAPGTVIAQNIIPLPLKEPSQVLFALLQFLIESATKITNVSNIMTGENPPGNQPATTTMALIEQGQQIYSSILYRIYESLRKEFSKLYNINRCYLDYEETFPMAEGVGIITTQDYLQPNYGIFPVADPKLSSNMQRMVQSQALLQLYPYPEVNKVRILQDYVLSLKIRDVKDYVPDPNPNPTPSMDDQIKFEQLKKIKTDALTSIMDRKLKRRELDIEEAKVKSQSAYYGGQLASEKIDGIVKLTELNRTATPKEVSEATGEEEILTKSTQAQDMS